MFRATVLSIVLTLAGGPNAALFCAVWCHPTEAVTSACGHPDADLSPGMTPDDSCDTRVAAVTVFVPNEAKRGQQAPQSAATAPGCTWVPPRTGATLAFSPNAFPAAASPPPLVALRI